MSGTHVLSRMSNVRPIDLTAKFSNPEISCLPGGEGNALIGVFGLLNDNSDRCACRGGAIVGIASHLTCPAASRGSATTPMCSGSAEYVCLQAGAETLQTEDALSPYQVIPGRRPRFDKPTSATTSASRSRPTCSSASLS
jgi:hypothetical protein